jgi:hypothetical protein
MGKPAGRQTRVIDTLPTTQKQKVIDALIAGESCRKVSAMIAQCGHTISYSQVAAYRREVIRPAVKTGQKLRELNRVPEDVSIQTRETANLTRQVIDAGPIIAQREKRVALLDEYLQRLQTVATERGADMPNVPGGKTGLLCRRIKQVGQGKDAQIVEEYELDGTLLREMREHAKQAAQELGQWEESARPTGSNVAVVVLPVAGLPGPAAPVPQVLPAGAVRFLPPGEPDTK